MHLKNYLKTARQIQSDFGQQLSPPVSQGLVSQWLRGRTRITLHYALQIKAATGGQVSPQELNTMYAKKINHG